ncbi:hypothetical protein NQ318_013329 [Aromia moschata]|uniref:Uncharacterized protein n=1 Tax=Aromia moschata TaxID=1265417 RepID=A0AAV8Y0E7_9CUCU|nr:hypothetical protein NQ318_013329 [Aromia moschata]
MAIVIYLCSNDFIKKIMHGNFYLYLNNLSTLKVIQENTVSSGVLQGQISSYGDNLTTLLNNKIN